MGFYMFIIIVNCKGPLVYAYEFRAVPYSYLIFFIPRGGPQPIVFVTYQGATGVPNLSFSYQGAVPNL